MASSMLIRAFTHSWFGILHFCAWNSRVNSCVRRTSTKFPALLRHFHHLNSMDFAHQKHQELNHKAYHKQWNLVQECAFFLPFYLQEWAETLKCRSYRFRKSLKRVSLWKENNQQKCGNPQGTSSPISKRHQAPCNAASGLAGITQREHCEVKREDSVGLEPIWTDSFWGVLVDILQLGWCWTGQSPLSIDKYRWISSASIPGWPNRKWDP